LSGKDVQVWPTLSALELTVAFGWSGKERKCWEDTLSINGTVNLGKSRTVELLRLQLPLTATPGLLPTRVRSGASLTGSGRTLLGVLGKLPLALTEPPTLSDAVRLDLVAAISTSMSTPPTLSKD